MNTNTTYFTDRSRIITYQECGRRRFLEYHESGLGIQSLQKPLPLAVGGAFHTGIEVLLRAHIGAATVKSGEVLQDLEHQAVAAAVADLGLVARDGLEVDAVEAAGILPDAGLAKQLAESLGLDESDPRVQEIVRNAEGGKARFDSYLVAEQSALVEGLVRAYCRRRLGKLLEQFEILEVEREGSWQLMASTDEPGSGPGAYEIVFMSRPDALLRDRVSSQIVILSLKTTASWDIRKARDAEHDMQGLSEGVEVEMRLFKWWEALTNAGQVFPSQFDEITTAIARLAQVAPGEKINMSMIRFLCQQVTPPRIYAIRYEFILKGDRKRTPELATELGVQEARVQNTHLVRPYCNAGNNVTDRTFFAWSYKFKKEDGSGSNLYYKTWRPTPVWEFMSMKNWIDILDTAVETYSGEDSTTGMEPRLLGYSTPGQPGYTDRHPLDDVFIEPITVFRNDDDLRDWIDQTSWQESRVVEGLVTIADSPGDLLAKRQALNRYFPMNRNSCEWPSTCGFVRVCYAASGDAKLDPLSTGKFRVRVPNHPIEASEAASEAAVENSPEKPLDKTRHSDANS